MANSSGSSGQRRPRQVGLANPRSARGRANEEEVERVALQNSANRDQNHQEAPPRVAVQNSANRDQNHQEAPPRVAVQNFPGRGADQEEFERVAIQNIMRNGEMGLDVHYEDSEFESSMESLQVRSRALTPEAQDAVDRELEIPDSPPEVLAARSRARNRHFWQGNDGKLNLMASKYLNQPLRQEIAANASGNADSIAHIRSLKRDPAQDLDHSNLKHSGKLFLVQATTDELNACEAFREYLPETQTLSVELCRQKIKEFQAIAVATPDASIDRRMNFFFDLNCSILFNARRS
jgi:hypothetical protein